MLHLGSPGDRDESTSAWCAPVVRSRSRTCRSGARPLLLPLHQSRGHAGVSAARRRSLRPGRAAGHAVSDVLDGGRRSCSLQCVGLGRVAGRVPSRGAASCADRLCRLRSHQWQRVSRWKNPHPDPCEFRGEESESADDHVDQRPVAGNLVAHPRARQRGHDHL